MENVEIQIIHAFCLLKKNGEMSVLLLPSDSRNTFLKLWALVYEHGLYHSKYAVLFDKWWWINIRYLKELLKLLDIQIFIGKKTGMSHETILKFQEENDTEIRALPYKERERGGGRLH